MNIVLFSHPEFLNSASMPRFARMIMEGMRKREHNVKLWAPVPIFVKLPFKARWRKWLGYLDQYVLFPLAVRFRLMFERQDTVFVFADQALGPWVPLVARRPNVVHVHDLLALRSALGEISQNQTSWTGQQYQAMIRRGFSKASNFICVSENTKKELFRLNYGQLNRADVVYNGLNFPFTRMTAPIALDVLKQNGLVLAEGGFLLHVGGNQWYKNRQGVLEIYLAYSRKASNPLPLLMVGDIPTNEMKALASQAAPSVKILFASGLSDEAVCAAYSLASLLIFPSLAEGFGWPIAEAMTCGCLVMTTDEPPMSEVGGDAGYYIPAMPESVGKQEWAQLVASQVIRVVSMSGIETNQRREKCMVQASKFASADALSAYERIYSEVLKDHNQVAGHSPHAQ